MHHNTNPEFNYIQILYDVVDKRICAVSCDAIPLLYPIMLRPPLPEVDPIPVNDPENPTPPVVSLTSEERYIYTNMKVRCLTPLDSSILSNNLVDTNGVFSFGDSVEIIETTMPYYPDETTDAE